MKRILTTFALSGLALGIGCGGGPGTSSNQSVVDDVTEGPAAGSEQPVNGSEQPASSETLAPPSEFGEQPATNPFQPPTSSTGGVDCDALCGLLICSEDVSVNECLTQCRAATAELETALREYPCLRESLDLFDCLIARGFNCEEISEEDALACSADIERAMNCIEEFEDGQISVDPPNDGPPRDGPPDVSTDGFPCSDGSDVIPFDWVCDGDMDCDDSSDESPTICG